MSIYLNEKKARLTVFGRGWNDEVVDSGDADTEDGVLIEGISDDQGYDWGTDLDWEAVADEIGIDINDGYYIDDQGNIYTDDDGDGIYTDGLGNEYTGDDDYNPYGYYEGFDGDFYFDYDGDGIYVDEYGIEYDGNGEYIASEVLQEKLSQGLSQLADDEETIYECMTDHGDSTGSPARIIITDPPDQIEYNDGDTIDFTGIVVCAYASLTTKTPFIRQEWDGPRHNQIPLSQLTFPVTAADRSGGNTVTGSDTEEELPDYTWVPIGDCSTTDAIVDDGVQMIDDEQNYSDLYAKRTTTYAKFGAFQIPGSVAYFWVMAAKYGTETTVYYVQQYGDNFSRYASNLSKKAKNISLIYTTGWGTPNYKPVGVKIFTGNTETVARSKVLDAMNDGKWEPETEPVEVSIPVQWQTEYREEPFEDTFDITVT